MIRVGPAKEGGVCFGSWRMDDSSVAGREEKEFPEWEQSGLRQRKCVLCQGTLETLKIETESSCKALAKDEAMEID